MYISIHSKFILTPAFNLLEEGVNACRAVGKGIETYPLTDYVLQSIFLRITGAQEQKLKCICWELASNDYAYRYDFLSKERSGYGEFSNYTQKNNFYCAFLDVIKKVNDGFNIEQFDWIENIDDVYKSELFNRIKTRLIKEAIENKAKSKEITPEISTKIETKVTTQCEQFKAELISKEEKREFVARIKKKMIGLLTPSVLSVVRSEEFAFWRDDDFLYSDDLALRKTLFDGTLKKIYEQDVIKHRHRCAHNLTSFQDNLPTLSVLSMSEYKYYNYFYRFFILILIDEVLIRLYKEYTESFKYHYL